jgi:nitrogen fixation NifU-like protein
MQMAQDFRKLMDSRGKGMPEDVDDERLGDAVVFQGVSRIRCASNALCSDGKA